MPASHERHRCLDPPSSSHKSVDNATNQLRATSADQPQGKYQGLPDTGGRHNQLG